MSSRKIRINFPRQLALVLCIVVCASVHGGRHRVEADERPAALIAYPDATDLRFDDRESVYRFSYRVTSTFPANPVIEFISNKLQKAGWEPLKNDFLNPDTPSSQVEGWKEFLDATDQPPLCVRQWLGDWKDASGNIVTYGFRYKQKCDAVPLTDLEVDAWYFPAIVAERILEDLQKHKQAQ
jgi:hypothetical protein